MQICKSLPTRLAVVLVILKVGPRIFFSMFMKELGREWCVASCALMPVLVANVLELPPSPTCTDY
jgi:hypothetical protein